jgi:hypothetical protein
MDNFADMTDGSLVPPEVLNFDFVAEAVNELFALAKIVSEPPKKGHKPSLNTEKLSSSES